MPKFSKSYSRDLLADNGLQMRVPRQLEPVISRNLYIVYSLLMHFWYAKDRIVLKAHPEVASAVVETIEQLPSKANNHKRKRGMRIDGGQIIYDGTHAIASP